ncbi:taspase, threonine aspartase, 1 [Mortierella sp. AD011]|nr:taspase, threonine aspartase, 1 [Mortierella sp. AD011]
MIRILEDDPVTNAGTGSNLNLDGQVECDASIMNGTTLGFGSVGAVSDFKNPISVATKILEEADQGPLSLGRIPPIMLVGSGVVGWVDTMGFTALDRVQPRLKIELYKEEISKSKQDEAPENIIEGSLVTKEALSRHLRFQTMLQDANAKMNIDEAPVYPRNQSSDQEKQPQKRKPQNSATTHDSALLPSSPSKKREKKEEGEDESLLQDTVGAICVDALGRVAAGVSSGGIAMKFPGRVSEAAIYGAGCWAQDPAQESPGFACSMTGAGEQICKTLLARTCMETLVYEEEEDITTAVNLTLDRFIKSPLLKNYDDRHVGFIAIKVCPAVMDDTSSNPEGIRRRAEFAFAHTTKTMGLAYMSTRDSKPTTILSQRKAETNKTVYTQMIKI